MDCKLLLRFYFNTGLMALGVFFSVAFYLAVYLPVFKVWMAPFPLSVIHPPSPPRTHTIAVVS